MKKYFTNVCECQERRMRSETMTVESGVELQNPRILHQSALFRMVVTATALSIFVLWTMAVS